MLWSVLAGVAMGVVSGVRRGRWQDQAIDGAGDLGHVVSRASGSGLLLIDLFSVRLGWLPTGGYGDWQHFIMPAFTLGLAWRR